MSACSEILNGLRTAIELNGKVVSIAGAVEKLSGDMRDFDRRLVRIETTIEITRPEGGTLRITRA